MEQVNFPGAEGEEVAANQLEGPGENVPHEPEPVDSLAASQTMTVNGGYAVSVRGVAVKGDLGGGFF